MDIPYLNKIDHIGIAVNSLEEVIKTYRNGFGLEPDHTEQIDEQKVKVACYKIGDSNIEYLEPTAEDSPIAGFLRKKGNGIHHIAYNVTNLQQKLAELKSKGFQLINETPRNGAGGTKIAFIHPKSTDGILIELCEVIYYPR